MPTSAYAQCACLVECKHPTLHMHQNSECAKCNGPMHELCGIKNSSGLRICNPCRDPGTYRDNNKKLTRAAFKQAKASQSPSPAAENHNQELGEKHNISNRISPADTNPETVHNQKRHPIKPKAKHPAQDLNISSNADRKLKKKTEKLLLSSSSSSSSDEEDYKKPPPHITPRPINAQQYYPCASHKSGDCRAPFERYVPIQCPLCFEGVHMLCSFVCYDDIPRELHGTCWPCITKYTKRRGLPFNKKEAKKYVPSNKELGLPRYAAVFLDRQSKQILRKQWY